MKIELNSIPPGCTISLTCLRVLAATAEAGFRGTIAAEMARLTGQSPASMTGVFDALEKAGLATRHFSASDRRQRRLLITAEGRHFIDQLRARPAVEQLATA